MNWVDSRLNANRQSRLRSFEYSTLFAPSTQVKLKSGKIVLASSVALGTDLSLGKVIAIIQKKSRHYCETPSGDLVSPGLLLWDLKTNQWFRAGDRYRIQFDPVDREYYNFIVSPSASVELSSGLVVRDYFEVHSPETEQFYAKAIQEASCVLAE